MSKKRLRQIERRTIRIKQELQKIGSMRPGSLTKQYKDPKNKGGPFWQLSYTRAMKSRTDYIRRDCVVDIRKQIAAYKRFKSLTDEWVDLSIESSKLTMKLDKEMNSQ